MERTPLPRTRPLTVIARDPSVRFDGKIVRAQVEVPGEKLRPGPWGYRVQVVDYDVSTDTFYKPRETDLGGDPYGEADDAALLADPGFHCQNVYALVMRTLARFERALGRHVTWGFDGHQLQVVPHAFADANAFYSREQRALLFGYFPGRAGTIFTCLSHDVIVHETTHALLDGLRQRYNDPSSPDQAAFHEGFSDVVALLSVFSLPGVAEVVIDLTAPPGDRDLIDADAVTPEKLRLSGLLAIAQQMGQELESVRGDALRRSVELTPSARYYQSRGECEDFIESHQRGEILVAAMMNAFLEVWSQRLQRLGEIRGKGLDRGRVVEEGAAIADALLTMSIRALDYAPPVDLQFGDFLSALLTGDTEVRPDDSRYQFRRILLESFRAYGIDPASDAEGQGTWKPAPRKLRYDYQYERIHFESMRQDRDEVFRFLWENRQSLGLCDEAYTRVLSLRPCLLIGPDGFALREVVAEYVQILDVRAAELKAYGMRQPDGMLDSQPVTIYGGGALIFDEYGRLKFHIHNNVLNAKRQSERIGYLWRSGAFNEGSSIDRRLSSLHRQRAMGLPRRHREEW